MMINEKKQFYSTTEAAALMGLSRVTIFNWIKKEKIQAIKIGRNFVISANEIEPFIKQGELTEREKKQISEAVHLAASEYAEAFKLLGKE